MPEIRALSCVCGTQLAVIGYNGHSCGDVSYIQSDALENRDGMNNYIQGTRCKTGKLYFQ
ncbi:MAG TPA: hypothetical protein VN844_23260 [Pyrinomonadaceae bacterium]|nr:hypothetical protein [Pyrinomonadaceae bacterium]